MLSCLIAREIVVDFKGMTLRFESLGQNINYTPLTINISIMNP